MYNLQFAIIRSANGQWSMAKKLPPHLQVSRKLSNFAALQYFRKPSAEPCLYEFCRGEKISNEVQRNYNFTDMEKKEFVQHQAVSGCLVMEDRYYLEMRDVEKVLQMAEDEYELLKREYEACCEKYDKLTANPVLTSVGVGNKGLFVRVDEPLLYGLEFGDSVCVYIEKIENPDDEM